ncbi:MAG: hypothetical protein OEQ13_15110 [Acidobacteriota bacterium]|nr:hypothetical protein [Acidobacteriota bacterium]
MHQIELIRDEDCPNAAGARDALRRALDAAGLPQSWKEWACTDPDAPEHVRGYGSPTILVDGQDVAGAEPSPCWSSCRIYLDEPGGPTGVPPVRLIVRALRRPGGRGPGADLRSPGRDGG